MPVLSHPQQHPLRALLHNEVHARPAEAIEGPAAIAHVVMLADPAQREASRALLADLLHDHHCTGPDADCTHLRVDLGTFRLRWELHTEFVSWTFMVPLPADAPLDTRAPLTAMEEVPQQWLRNLPGECLSSIHLWIVKDAQCEGKGMKHLVQQMLNADTLAGAAVHAGHTEVCTDFAIHADGYSRMLVKPSDSISARRMGRLVQRLLEIETYRMAALLGLPAARKAASVLGAAEKELAELANAIREADRDAEPALLDHLTRLAGQVESEYAATHSRFSASKAYFELVDKRIQDLREERLSGLLTIQEFMERRLSPARSTCEWAVHRQNALSQRVSRVSNLLRTRVEIEQQQSNQEILATMNDRQGTQLKLQSTVEGLSVAAITYYITGLITYLSKGAQKLGWPLSPEITAAVAIPVVAFSVWWSLRRLHHKLFGGKH
ncbi:hypothetical protein BMF38_06830 [Comamonas kerstersii]|uniref:DUF3422 family protein n=1 Tax=Comamonas kerstersii TaxID=225992 RepID=UPI000984E683|nr:DUF3422 domain-containing protein [Comamonas kerstersii]OOH86777.1 hypothetical protein BMF38_06830 [Comamonas kerstersii]